MKSIFSGVFTFVKCHPPFLTKSISLREVYEAIEGDLQLVDCMDGDQVCELFKTCNQRSIWDHLQLNTLDFLSKISVNDLASKKFNN